MSYMFIKHNVKVIEVEKIKRNFMKHRLFSAVRKDKPACEVCDAAFEPEDNTNLAFVKDMKNHLICDDCATEAIENGVKEINW